MEGHETLALHGWGLRVTETGTHLPEAYPIAPLPLAGGYELVEVIAIDKQAQRRQLRVKESVLDAPADRPLANAGDAGGAGGTQSL